MGYKTLEKDDNLFFKYIPVKNNKKNLNKKVVKESPFGILKNLNFN